MINPVYYLQTDPRWKDVDYSAKGESTTIGKSGCGPTCAAMVIASLKDASVTPKTTAQWSLAHGYKALHSGTYYSYFVPQLAAYGIKARQMNQINNYHHKDQATLRASITRYLQAGKWVIACMGKGTWTSSGHFILAYGFSAGGKVLINDPASTKLVRTQGDLNTFLNEAKYFWLVEGTGSEKPKEEKEDGMTAQEKQEINEMINVAIKNAINGDYEGVSDWAKEMWEDGKKLGITDGSRPHGLATREEVLALILRTVRVGDRT